MNLRAALLAMATTGAFLLVAACGGGDGGSGSSQSQPASQPQQSQAGNQAQPNDAPVRYVAIDLYSSGYEGTMGWGIGAGQQVGLRYSYSTHPYVNVEHAVLWRDSASSVVDLHPNGFGNSWAFATDGTTQVGRGGVPGKFFSHALKWSGSADSVVDLDPNGVASEARGVAGDQIVGSRHMDGQYHAVLWTSRGVVDLAPNGFMSSEAKATDGAQQVGGGGTCCEFHALLWSGTASSAVDLHPAGYTWSVAQGVGGGQQVGYVLFRSGDLLRSHALLWTGNAESVVDLHPSGFDESEAFAVAAGRQVGYGQISGRDHALLWNGTADSVMDLHVFLPPGFYQSRAHGIDASGNIIGHADGHAILWVRQ